MLVLTVHLGPGPGVADGHALHQVVRRGLHVDWLPIAAKGVLALHNRGHRELF